MPADPALVSELTMLVRRMVAETLVVSEERVGPDTPIIAELGAESIDFLDLVFRLEEVLGPQVTFQRWQAWLDARFGVADRSKLITPRVVEEFALSQLS